MSVTALAPQRAAEGELRSVSIAVGVLDCFTTAAELGPTQVARTMGIAKSTASRMLSALATGGMLERTAAGRYRLGLRLVQCGQLAIDRLPVRAVARPVLLDLHESLRMVVQLGLPVGGHVLYVDRLGAGGSGRLGDSGTTSAVGARPSGEVLRRVPGYSSSAGQIMAAFDPQVARETAAVERRRHIPYPVTDPRRLQRILHQARQVGWVGGRDELAPGYSSIAAPILVEVAGGPPRVAGAVSVVGPTGHVLGPRTDFITASALRAGRRISAGLAAGVEA